MQDRFVIWDFDDVPKAHVPDDLLNMDNPEDRLALLMGKSFAGRLPEGLQLSADPDYAGDVLMLDTFGNTESLIPVSPRLKAFLEARGLAHVEFIPVDMLDQSGETIERYFLLHCVNVIDAIDKTLTELEVDDLNEEMYETVEDLVLKSDVVPKGVQIFRVKGLYDATCITRSLAREIDDHGFTGAFWQEVSDYSR